jgi:hypothetical protein
VILTVTQMMLRKPEWEWYWQWHRRCYSNHSESDTDSETDHVTYTNQRESDTDSDTYDVTYTNQSESDTDDVTYTKQSESDTESDTDDVTYTNQSESDTDSDTDDVTYTNQSESDTDSDTDDVTYTNFTQWTDRYKLSTYCACSPQVYKGSERVMTNRATPQQYTSSLSILTARQGRQSPSMSQLKRLDISHNRHWLTQCTRICCRMFRKKQTRMQFKCWECNISLCAIQCFEVYHTKLHFWWSADTKVEEQNTQMSVNATVASSWWNNGGKWGVDFTEGGLWRKRDFDVCVTVHHVWKWWDVPTWCNNCDLLL